MLTSPDVFVTIMASGYAMPYARHAGAPAILRHKNRNGLLLMAERVKARARLPPRRRWLPAVTRWRDKSTIIVERYAKDAALVIIGY